MRQDLIKLWTGPLPPEHLWVPKEKRPQGYFSLLRLYFRKWLIHPLKRKTAKYYLIFLKAFCGLKVIAITGSAGKTTTTEMLKSVLSLQGQTVASRINIDPIYNIPTTILECTPNTKYLILEMGIEYPGEMDFYIWLAKPDVAVITNVNVTHTEFLKDIPSIAREKSGIGKFAADVVINSGDPNIAVNTAGRVHKVRSSDYKFNLQLLGTHLETNAALAAKTAQILGVGDDKIKEGIEKLATPPQRLHLIKSVKFTLIDDSYNANPLATKASINTLVGYAKKHKLTPVFVFAQMNELGQFEKSAHREIADLVAKLGIKHFLTYGPANQNYGQYFDNQKDLIAATRKFLTSKYVILIKGSRKWKMENVVEALINQNN